MAGRASRRERTFLVVGIFVLGLSSSFVTHVRQLNPTWRSPDTWTEDDLRTLFFCPSLHWCKRYHGCTHDPTSWYRCKGRLRGVVRTIEARRSEAAERVLIELVEDPDFELAARVSETLGVWGCDAARPALRARLRELVAHPDESGDDLMTLAAVSWALEQLRATDALGDLRRAEAKGWFPAHAVAVLESRGTCSGCTAPHRR